MPIVDRYVQRQGVNEGADQILNLGKIPISDRATHNDLCLSGIAVKERHERRQQSHE